MTQMLSERCDSVIVKNNNENVAENCYSDSTVYDYNSRYGCEPQEPVVKAVYAESLPSNPHELTKEGRGLLARNTDSKVYSFPISRLVLIDDAENRS